jgi:hypothetical protein
MSDVIKDVKLAALEDGANAWEIMEEAVEERLMRKRKAQRAKVRRRAAESGLLQGQMIEQITNKIAAFTADDAANPMRVQQVEPLPR